MAAMISGQEVLLRLLAALLFCGAIGVQRFLAGKAAGVRTHILVGLGAALFTLISGYAFGATAANADRIAAQVVTGIGFIGGGAILKEGGAIKGLTTAAGLWAVAALGMAAGAGLYTIGGLGTLIILITLVLLRRAELLLPRHLVNSWTIRVTLAEGTSIGAMRKAVETYCRSAWLEELVSDEVTQLCFAAQLPYHFDIDALNAQIRAAGARVVSWQANEGGNLEGGA
jgi:putative Mg2+ transporter-C (MgtC) family protein